MELLIVLGVLWTIFGALGSWVATQKNRDGGEGAVLGFLFGPLGVLIEALLPAGQPKASGLTTPEQRAEWERAEREVARAEQAREEAKAAKAAAEAAELERQDRIARARRKALRKKQMLAQWQATPDWVKMIFVGLGVGTAVCIPIIILWSSTSPGQ
jgi:hypothetical protein